MRGAAFKHIECRGFERSLVVNKEKRKSNEGKKMREREEDRNI